MAQEVADLVGLPANTDAAVVTHAMDVLCS
jgi:hypothetical protein